VSRHQRLQRTMRTPQRAARRARKHRPSAERRRAYQDHRVPLSALLDLVPQWKPVRR
jgi:hypothetical protein